MSGLRTVASSAAALLGATLLGAPAAVGAQQVLALSGDCPDDCEPAPIAGD